ncbi:CPBP family intramembrane metalloprotease [Flavobacterium sp. MAH-1]|uniref:CPBP family intramembrane metalloprotease n=1 Tax=Flavobacterium agri TaxID=2743471 RepID=A0A7Y9C6B0_9FLAO|nr:CPBP family intramembrane glutamic endopeptidase [Flavobacterium agri]NUY80027.1 CPBP family intramembrane metalloprotease [Flavobacterium agri]NYA70052.1 CPBP family intramembrane metalloprotease [Flavobacterium agri]
MFIEQAYKGDNTPWKVALTTLLTTGIFIVNFMYVFFFLSATEVDQMYDMLKTTPKNVMLVANLFPFALLLGLLFLMVRALHERSLLSLTTSRKKIDFGRIFFSFTFIVLLTIGTFWISYEIDPSDLVWNFDPFKFSVLLVLSVLLFPAQIAFEEYLFRGFLMQQIGVATASRAVPFVITSILFGLFHSANPEVGEMGPGVMVFYIGTGFLLGIMTLMDEGLELALGFHLGNNLMAALLVTSDFSALQTDAVFRYTAQKDSGDMLSEMIVSIVITYPLILLILGKKYKWKGWREKLFGKVSKVEPKTISHDEYSHLS